MVIVPVITPFPPPAPLTSQRHWHGDSRTVLAHMMMVHREESRKVRSADPSVLYPFHCSSAHHAMRLGSDDRAPTKLAHTSCPTSPSLAIFRRCLKLFTILVECHVSINMVGCRLVLSFVQPFRTQPGYMLSLMSQMLWMCCDGDVHFEGACVGTGQQHGGAVWGGDALVLTPHTNPPSACHTMRPTSTMKCETNRILKHQSQCFRM